LALNETLETNVLFLSNVIIIKVRLLREYLTLADIDYPVYISYGFLAPKDI